MLLLTSNNFLPNFFLPKCFNKVNISTNSLLVKQTLSQLLWAYTIAFLHTYTHLLTLIRVSLSSGDDYISIMDTVARIWLGV